jgi:diacylglycerol kinase (ATP)
MPQPEGQPLLFFVINPVSGGKTKQDWETAITDFFRDKPYRTELFVLSKEHDGDSVLHYLETLQPHRVIAVGGDGTIKIVAEQIAKKNYTLAILPAGSANGMAKELGIPADITAALDVIINGVEKSIDVIEIDGKHKCLHLSDLGLNAQLVRYYENHPGRGMISYARFVFKTLWNRQRFKVIIDSDSEDRQRDAYMVVLANARMYGTGAAINPEGDVSDGCFEIVILRQISIVEAFKMLRKSKDLNSYKTEILKVNQVKIVCDKPVHFQIDGEYIGKTKEVHAKILRNVLKVMVPKPEE